MSGISENELDKLLGDIKSIKSVIGRNRPLIQQIMLPVNFRLVTLLIGISVIVFSLIFHFMIERYGSYNEIPQQIRYLMWFLLIADYLLLGILKRVFWLRSMREYGRKISFSQIIREMYSFHTYHVWVPAILMIIILSVFLVNIGQAYYIVPTISIGMGIAYNFMGALTSLRAYLISGYWMFITGTGVLLYPNLSVVIALILSLGCGMLLFALVAGPPSEAGKEE
jgi:hypothetical protein